MSRMVLSYGRSPREALNSSVGVGSHAGQDVNQAIALLKAHLWVWQKRFPLKLDLSHRELEQTSWLSEVKGVIQPGNRFHKLDTEPIRGFSDVYIYIY